MQGSTRIGAGLALCVVLNVTNAATNGWSAVGPDGGSVSSIAYLRASTGDVIASTNLAIYRSENNGQDWLQMLRYPHDGDMPVGIAVNPADPDRVILISNHVYRSVDGGRTWNFPSGPPAQIPSFAQRPTCVAYSRDGAVVWIGSESGRVYRSVDFGASWQDHSNGLSLSAGGVVEVDVDAASAAVAYVRTGNGNLYRTIDSGANWTALAAGEVHSGLAASLTEPNVLLALRNPYPFRSINRGDTWIQSSLPNFVHIEFAPGTPARAMGILRTSRGFASRVTSDNGAIFWVGGSRIPFGGVRALAIHPGNHDRALVGGALGLAATSDSSSTWVDGMRGIREATFERLIVAGDGTDLIHAPSYDAAFVYRRDPTSAEWQAVGRQAWEVFGAPNTSHFALARGYDSPNTLYMSRNGAFGRSDDGGATWQTLSSQHADALAFDPRNSAVGYAASRTTGIFKTTNGTTTWNPVNSGLETFAINEVTIDPNDSSILYAGKWTGAPSAHGVYKSIDAGASWTAASSGLGVASVHRLAFQPGSSAILYAATDLGLFKTKSAGAWWELVLKPDTGGVSDVAIDPQMPTTIYATPSNETFVRRSIDGGETWEPLNDGRPDSGLPGTSVALLPSKPNVVIAARRSAGLFEMEIAPDLQLQSSRPVAMLGSPESITFTVTNNGPYAVSQARFTATVPVNFKATELRSSAGPCAYIPPNLNCPLRSMQAKATTTILLEGTANGATGTIAASVSAYEPDALPNNNSITVPIQRHADVRVAVRAEPNSVFEQDFLNYLLTVTNDGPNAAENVRVTLSYMSGEVKGSVPSECVAEARSVTCEFDTLGLGVSRTIPITFAYSRAGTFPATATVNSSGLDSIADNNTAAVDVEVKSRPSTVPSGNNGGGSGGGGEFHWAFILIMTIVAEGVRRRRSCR